MPSNNEALINFPIKYVVSIAGKIYLTENTTTDDKGKANINFTLPQNLTSQDGLISVLVDFEGEVSERNLATTLKTLKSLDDYMASGNWKISTD